MRTFSLRAAQMARHMERIREVVSEQRDWSEDLVHEDVEYVAQAIWEATGDPGPGRMTWAALLDAAQRDDEQGHQAAYLVNQAARQARAAIMAND